MVIDIFPKPGQGSTGSNLDQTLGIPVRPTYDGGGSGGGSVVPGVMKTNLPRQPMHLNPLVAQQGPPPPPPPFNKTERPQFVHQYPLISGQIPPANGVGGELLSKYSVLMAQPRPFSDAPQQVQPSAMATGGSGGAGGGAGTSSNSSKSSGEKNKVKFSETIQVAVLPEIPRKEKQMDHRMMMKGGRGMPGGSGMQRLMYTDPRKELMESLPLCHPNEDYLKDFQPANNVEGE